MTLALVLLTVSSAWAANFSGKWTMSLPGRGGRRVETVLLLHQAGSVVSGTVSNAGDLGTGSPVNTEIFGTKVDGDHISFYVWKGSEEPAKLFYEGTLVGDEIHFTLKGGPLRANSGFSGVLPVTPKDAHVIATR